MRSRHSTFGLRRASANPAASGCSRPCAAVVIASDAQQIMTAESPSAESWLVSAPDMISSSTQGKSSLMQAVRNSDSPAPGQRAVRVGGLAGAVRDELFAVLREHDLVVEGPGADPP